MADTKIQRFKFTIPIVKTSTKIVKDEKGNEVEERYVEGVASGTELDKHGDRMAPSAIESMAKSLKQHVIALNAEHDTSWLGELGDIDKLEVAENNDLGIKAKLNEMSSAKDLWYALREQNKKLGLSIGGYVKDYEMVKEGEGDDAKWVRLYKKIDLDHIAVTSRPAYPKAWVSVISKSIESKADNELILKKEMEEIQKPYPNEHACRLKSPGQYDVCRRGTRSHNGKQYSIIFCKKTGGKMEEQAYRYNKKTWSAGEAGSHCRAHGGTFSAARRGEKSLEDNEEKSRRSQKDKRLRELAKKIARKVQVMEADLLLELTYTGLQFCDEELLSIIERSLSVAEKNVSLEAKKAKKKADAKKSKPEDKKDETLAAPENEESKEEEAKEEKSDKKDKASKKSESKKAGKEKGENAVDAEKAELLKAVQKMSEGMKKVLKSNEKLVKRVEELEAQPAGRKTVEIKKGLGDEEGSDKTAEELVKECKKKIEEARKEYANDPNLFARIQRIRSEYAQKAQE